MDKIDTCHDKDNGGLSNTSPLDRGIQDLEVISCIS